MKMSSIRIGKASWISAFALAAVLLAPTANAQSSAAPTPEQVASRCVEGIRATTHHGVNGIFDATRRTVNAIFGLADEGAPAFIIWRVASEGRSHVNAIARAHAERINGITAKCVRVLREMNADEALIKEVVRARARGLHYLKRAHDGAVQRIYRAANEVTGPPVSIGAAGDVINVRPLNEGNLSAD